MQTVNISEFKDQCLNLIDDIEATGEEIIIVKNGQPISILRAYKKQPRSLFASHKNIVKSHDDLIKPVSNEWDAE